MEPFYAVVKIKCTAAKQNISQQFEARTASRNVRGKLKLIKPIIVKRSFESIYRAVVHPFISN